MVQGTTSDAGKSTLVAALCRWLARQGVSVAPFKPQNMALNAAVTIDGGEIGRSTALQALACGIAPHSDMNPVLLKPQSDRGAQVILRGRVLGTMDAMDYHAYKAVARDSVMAAWEALKRRYDVLLVEGAGSPAEVNLREGDIANMGFATGADCPVLLVADIDRGGVFAQVVGTLALLSEAERSLIQGVVINRFRGDMALLRPGLDWLRRRTDRAILGVLPYLQDWVLDAEDSVAGLGIGGGTDALQVVIPVYPRISNHNDLDPLRLHPHVSVHFVGPNQPIPPADLIVLPGSKSTRADLAWLRRAGWDAAIARHLRYGGKVLGLCGGYQMLGRKVADPDGIEGSPGFSEGLGWLEMETHLRLGKQLRFVEGRIVPEGAPFSGYEIHNGTTDGAASARPLVEIQGRPDGAVSEDGQVMGCYVHGLLDRPEAAAAILARCGLQSDKAVDYDRHRQAALDHLADCVEAHLDTGMLRAMLGL